MRLSRTAHSAGPIFLTVLLFIDRAVPVPAADFDYQLVGHAADAKPAHTEGALLLRGGGGSVDEAFRWFLKKAGGGGIVILKASAVEPAAQDTFATHLHDSIGGCDSVEVITFKNRNAASDPKVLQTLQNAEGIFLGGGKQFLYADYWKGTAVSAALDSHVRAGRPLGGSSAGLAVLGQYCYTAHVTASLRSEATMENPFDKAITLERDFLHLDLMKGVITDTHFTTRGRLGRLITFLARISTENDAGDVLGIGVDEKSAVCIEADGSARVLSTSSEGHAWFLQPQEAPKVLRPGQPLTYRNLKVTTAGPQSTINLATRTFANPISIATASIEAGKLTVGH